MIGPGRLVLVVGPSGAGKDTLLAGARTLSQCYPTISFARRVVTRPSSNSEDHDSLTEAAFCDALARGAFTIWWQAHGCYYAIPRRIDDEICDGCTVVCNVSRAIVDKLRTTYANTTVVLITAPLETLAKRLSVRARASDETVERRLARNDLFVRFEADHVIENSGSVDTGVAKLLEIIARHGALMSTTVNDRVRR